jgi:hypothetical protein
MTTTDFFTAMNVSNDVIKFARATAETAALHQRALQDIAKAGVRTLAQIAKEDLL